MIAGNTLSALVGITTYHFLDQSLLAIPVAASLSILGIFMVRCLYPPAATVALIAILSHVGIYRYAFFPVMVDSVLLILAGAVYSNLTGKSCPKSPKKPYLILLAAIEIMQTLMA